MFRSTTVPELFHATLKTREERRGRKKYQGWYQGHSKLHFILPHTLAKCNRVQAKTKQKKRENYYK